MKMNRKLANFAKDEKIGRKGFVLALLAIAGAMLFMGCQSLTRVEEVQLKYLKGKSVTVDNPLPGYYEKPNSLWAAGALNLLPGFGNFYLSFGNGSSSEQAIFGTLNLLTWPLSILWGVPEAVFDANTLNKRELLYYYQFVPTGKEEAAQAGIDLRNLQ